jgi:HTH-type transcriptional regulator / antitoxin HigA
MKQWFLIETDKEYQEATKRFEQIHEAKKGAPEFKEMLLLAYLISDFEKKQWALPEVDPIEMIRIRLEDFGYKPADLARQYGDKGTISKVMNYKQALSLHMIRLFSKLLRIPAHLLTKEYSLKEDGSHTATRKNNIRQPRQQRKSSAKRRSTRFTK